MKALNASSINLRRFGPLIEDTRMVITSLSSWQINNIFQEANCMTHKLAKAVVKHVIDHVWLEKIFTCIYDIVFLEQ